METGSHTSGTPSCPAIGGDLGGLETEVATVDIFNAHHGDVVDIARAAEVCDTDQPDAGKSYFFQIYNPYPSKKQPRLDYILK